MSSPNRFDDSTQGNTYGYIRQPFLPPIRTVLGPELERRARSPQSTPGGTSWNESDSEYPQRNRGGPSGSYSSGATFTGRLNRGRAATVSNPYQTRTNREEESNTLYLTPTLFPHAHSLPPTPSIPSPGHSDSHSDESSVNNNAQVLQSTGDIPAQPVSAPSFSFGVLRPNAATGELISTAPIVRRPRNPKRQNPSGGKRIGGALPNLLGDNPVNERRHICEICHKPFNRPSSLRTHQSVHTGLRPHACLYPECEKTFTVASNMRRHFRKHHAGSFTGGRRGHSGGIGTSSAYTGGAGDHDSNGSSVSDEGDADMELEGDASAVTAAPVPVPSGLPVPAAHFFQWMPSHTEDMILDEPDEDEDF